MCIQSLYYIIESVGPIKFKITLLLPEMNKYSDKYSNLILKEYKKLYELLIKMMDESNIQIFIEKIKDNNVKNQLNGFISKWKDENNDKLKPKLLIVNNSTNNQNKNIKNNIN